MSAVLACRCVFPIKIKPPKKRAMQTQMHVCCALDGCRRQTRAQQHGLAELASCERNGIGLRQIAWFDATRHGGYLNRDEATTPPSASP